MTEHPDDDPPREHLTPEWTVGSVLALGRFMLAERGGDQIEAAVQSIRLWSSLFGREPAEDKPLREIGEEVAAAINLLGTSA